MPARILLAIAAFLFAGTGAQVPAREADPPLWVVRDADTVVYLFGSIHWLKSGLGWFDDGVARAFAASDTLVLETMPADPAAARAMQDRLGKTSGGPVLAQRLPVAARGKLAAAIAELGYPADAFDRTEPWLAATTLSTLPLRRAGYDAAAGVEAVLTRAAKEAGKPIEGLEARAQQLGYFDALPDAAQIAMLMRTLDAGDAAVAENDRVLAAWAAGDARALGRIVEADRARSSAAFNRAIVSERNARFAAWIEARMARPGTVFVAVGVGHLTGRDTVQRALARRGMRVRRLRY